MALQASRSFGEQQVLKFACAFGAECNAIRAQKAKNAKKSRKKRTPLPAQGQDQRRAKTSPQAALSGLVQQRRRFFAHPVQRADHPPQFAALAIIIDGGWQHAVIMIHQRIFSVAIGQYRF